MDHARLWRIVRRIAALARAVFPHQPHAVAEVKPRGVDPEPRRAACTGREKSSFYQLGAVTEKSGIGQLQRVATLVGPQPFLDQGNKTSSTPGRSCVNSNTSTRDPVKGKST